MTQSTAPEPVAPPKAAQILGALALLLVVTIVLTWPQALFMGTKVAAHNDPHFSTWRLAWISHALRTPGSNVFDTNMFYPEPRTLAYSDATLLEGVVAAPLFWLRVNPIIIYNLLLLFGIAASAAAMFWLCLRLTGHVVASLIAAVAFGCLPYRIEHFMHLELQWTMWIPLSLICIHKASEDGSFKAGAAAGLCVGLQFLSCVYYGIFLGMFVGVISIALLACTPARRIPRLLAALSLGAVIALALMVPYSQPYAANAQVLGGRNIDEVTQYSASLSSYVAAPTQNWLYGWTADRFGSTEARLFPGLGTLALAIVGLFSTRKKLVAVYIVGLVMSVELSLGLNGYLYKFLHQHIGFFSGLRAPARFGVLALSALCVMAAFGAEFVLNRIPRSTVRAVVAAACILGMMVEFSSSPMFLTDVSTKMPMVYQLLNGMEPGVLLELPVPRLDRLPGKDPLYVYWSTKHWRPMVNGYSGYYPSSYIRTLEIMRSFPKEESMARLKRLNVRFIIIHRGLYELTEEYDSVVSALTKRDDVVNMGRADDWMGEARLFELK